MADNRVKLYGFWGSPFSKRVEIALKLKGVVYEYVEEDLRNKSPDLLRYNPVHKAVPVLVHGSKSIAESHVIIEYIDETWDSGACDLMPSAVKTFWLGEEESTEETLEKMKILDKELEGKRFFGGESIGLLDLVATAVGYWLDVVVEASGKATVMEEATPSLRKWWDEFVECGVVQETLPPREKLVDFIKARIALGEIGLFPDRPHEGKK